MNFPNARANQIPPNLDLDPKTLLHFKKAYNSF